MARLCRLWSWTLRCRIWRSNTSIFPSVTICRSAPAYAIVSCLPPTARLWHDSACPNQCCCTTGLCLPKPEHELLVGTAAAALTLCHLTRIILVPVSSNRVNLLALPASWKVQVAFIELCFSDQAQSVQVYYRQFWQTVTTFQNRFSCVSHLVHSLICICQTTDTAVASPCWGWDFSEIPKKSNRNFDTSSLLQRWSSKTDWRQWRRRRWAAWMCSSLTPAQGMPPRWGSQQIDRWQHVT